jgi:hypothetical protein
MRIHTLTPRIHDGTIKVTHTVYLMLISTVRAHHMSGFPLEGHHPYADPDGFQRYHTYPRSAVSLSDTVFSPLLSTLAEENGSQWASSS